MKGGINAWNGITAKGAPEWGIAFFKDTDKIEELILLAWSLEEGSRQFYESLQQNSGDSNTRDAFEWLKNAEINHQSKLDSMYNKSAERNHNSLKEYADSITSGYKTESIIEGQIKYGEAILWANSKPLSDVLEFSISLESQQYDLYMRLRQREKNEERLNIFSFLSAEEKKHLDKVTELFDHGLK